MKRIEFRNKVANGEIKDNTKVKVDYNLCIYKVNHNWLVFFENEDSALDIASFKYLNKDDIELIKEGEDSE